MSSRLVFVIREYRKLMEIIDISLCHFFHICFIEKQISLNLRPKIAGKGNYSDNTLFDFITFSSDSGESSQLVKKKGFRNSFLSIMVNFAF